MCLQVFTTCGSDRKKQYLLDTFPQLREDHIGHSRDCSFEDLIMHKVRVLCFRWSWSHAGAPFATPKTASSRHAQAVIGWDRLVLAWPLPVQKHGRDAD